MTLNITAVWHQAKAISRKLATIMGLIIMITTNAAGSPVFKLKTPQHYFADQGTLDLLASALAGDLDKARQLVAKGANPNDEGPRDNQYNRLRLLHYAIASNSAVGVKTLIAVGADPELNAQGFGEALLFVLTLKNLDILSLLLDLRPVHTLSRKTLKAMLFESVTQPCQSCLALLLKRGAPIDYQDDAGYTVMMAAMDAQDYDLAEWLLLQGASVHVMAGGCATPAYSAQFHLQKFKPGSPTYNKVLHIKKLMEERGAVFPAPSPAEIRARRAKQL